MTTNEHAFVFEPFRLGSMRLNILQFPSIADAQAWYNSPEYQAALPHRLNSSEYRSFIVEGL